MKLLIVFYPGDIIPKTIVICENVVEIKEVKEYLFYVEEEPNLHITLEDKEETIKIQGYSHYRVIEPESLKEELMIYELFKDVYSKTVVEDNKKLPYLSMELAPVDGTVIVLFGRYPEETEEVEITGKYEEGYTHGWVNEQGLTFYPTGWKQL